MVNDLGNDQVQHLNYNEEINMFLSSVNKNVIH